MKTPLLLLTLCFLLNACTTNQKNRLAVTTAGIATGAIVGASTAPADERKEMHALYWGGIIGVISAIAANYYWSDEKDLEVMKLENEKMKAQLDFFQKSPATLVYDSADYYLKKNKPKVKVYKIDQWVDEGPNKKYHRDQMIEILPTNHE